MRKDKQVVVITGCSSGIGRALALELVRRGHRTFATARRIEAIADLRDAGAETLPLDVTDEVSIKEATAAIVERAGRIDILVNNAGVTAAAPLAEIPLARFRAVLETNVTGLVAMVQAVVPVMARQRSGRIVNLGSVMGVLGTPFAGPYCATKAAVHMLSDVLRMEVEPFGIDVIVLAPGGVRSSIAVGGSQGIELYERESSLYHRAAAGIRKRAGASQVNPMETDEFARKVVDAITAQRAPRVVRLGRGSLKLVAMKKLLPATMLERGMQRHFGLDALRR